MNTLRRQSGFTLIEIMIVIAIIGILAVIAIPAMKDHAIRARVTELLSVASTPKTAVAEYHITHNAWPSTSTECGLSPIKSTYVNSVEVGKEGVITIVGDDAALGTNGPLIITLSPSYADGTIKWECRAHGQTQYAPALCRK